MTNDSIIYEKTGHVARITINRPDQRNALDLQCHQLMREAFVDFADDENMRVAILTGVGDKAFCAGADLKELSRRQAAGEDSRENRPVWGGITSNFNCWKPIIAAVNGFALGGGTELCLACDIVIAADSAQFGLPEPRRGIIAGAGGVHRLARQVPLKQAMGMILTGKTVSAAEAYRIGLVNEVVQFDSLPATADRWANEILECAPLSVQGSKEAILTYLHCSVEEAMSVQDKIFAKSRTSDDAREGPLAFAEKRPPNWTGH